jgi:hypothetical protein
MFLNLEKRLNLHSLWLKILQYRKECADNALVLTGIRSRISVLENFKIWLTPKLQEQIDWNIATDASITALNDRITTLEGNCQ